MDVKKKALECFLKLQQIEDLILEMLNKSIEQLLVDDLLVERLLSSTMQSKKTFKAL